MFIYNLYLHYLIPWDVNVIFIDMLLSYQYELHIINATVINFSSLKPNHILRVSNFKWHHKN